MGRHTLAKMPRGGPVQMSMLYIIVGVSAGPDHTPQPHRRAASSLIACRPGPVGVPRPVFPSRRAPDDPTVGGPMPAPTTVDEFVDLVRKSSVLDEPRLSGYVQKLKADSATPADLNSIAGLFVRDGLLTYFQAEQFLQGRWKRFTIGKYKVLARLGSG